MIKRLLSARCPGFREKQFAAASWSQEGEDMVLRKEFQGKANGFYVDVGAHDPHRFSNTYTFYKSGWRGINVDARPGCMRLFERCRPRDINVEAAISEQPTLLNYYIFEESALNTFVPALAQEREAKTPYRVTQTIVIQTRTLAQILAEHLPTDVQIDFLSVDVEGLDFEVLKSNDWSRFRPAIVVVEQPDVSPGNVESTPLSQFMFLHGYRSYCVLRKTAIYKLR